MWYLQPIFDSYLLVAGALAVLGGLLLLTVRTGGLDRKRRGVLVGLRLAVLLLLAGALLQPSRITTHSRRQIATLVVLLDTSRSMLVPDDGNRTRWEQLRRSIESAEAELAALEELFEVKVVGFDSESRTLQFDGGVIELPQSPEGDESAMGAALEDVLREEGNRRLVGIVLLSDGAQQAIGRTLPPQDPLARMADTQIPLWAVPFGTTGGGPQTKDIAIANLLAGGTVYAKNTLTVDGDVQINGFAGQSVQVELLFGKDPSTMQVVSRKPIRAAKGSERLPVKFEFTPESGGEYKLTLRALTQPGELVTTNNERSTYITVLDGGIRVLYLEESLRPEQYHLRHALDASPDVNVDFLRFDKRKRATWPVSVGDRFDAGRYDVYIIGDLDSDAFRIKVPTGDPKTDYPQLARLAESIDHGAGWMMLGGYHSFGPGGYQKTPLADVLPIEMGALVRQNYDDEIQRRYHLEPPLPMKPTKLPGRANFLHTLDAAAWERLPPLDGANKFQGIRPLARVLADAGEDRPLLVASEYNQGRVLAFAGDSTWRWKLHGERLFHQQFWRQIILWLAHKDETDQGDVWVKLSRRQFLPGEQVAFTAGARTPQGTPIADATFEAVVEAPRGQDAGSNPLAETVRMVRQGMRHRGTAYSTTQPGDYTVRVTATAGGKTIGTARARFLVQSQDLELANAGADLALLHLLAKMTEPAGGKVVAHEQLANLLEELGESPEQWNIEIPTLWTFGRQRTDGALLLLAMVGLMSVEWFLRKRWGLV